MKEPSRVARRIKRLRESKKLTRAQFADKLGVTYLQVYRIEKGISEVQPESVPDFARALDCQVDDLVRGLADFVVRRAS